MTQSEDTKPEHLSKEEYSTRQSLVTKEKLLPLQYDPQNITREELERLAVELTAPSFIEVETPHEKSCTVNLNDELTWYIMGTTVERGIFIADDANVDKRAISQIGDNTKILAGSVGARCKLGASCIVLGNLRDEVTCGDECTFGPQSIIHSGNFGDKVQIGRGAQTGKYISCGNYVDIGDNTSLAGRVILEDLVSIGKYCALQGQLKQKLLIAKGAVIGDYCEAEFGLLVQEHNIIRSRMIISKNKKANSLKLTPIQ